VSLASEVGLPDYGGIPSFLMNMARTTESRQCIKKRRWCIRAKLKIGGIRPPFQKSKYTKRRNASKVNCWAGISGYTPVYSAENEQHCLDGD